MTDNSGLHINNKGALGKVVSRLHVPCVTMKDSGAVYACLATAGVSSAIDYAQLRVAASLGTNTRLQIENNLERKFYEELYC